MVKMLLRVLHAVGLIKKRMLAAVAICLTFSSLQTKAQNVTIPDPNFAAYLQFILPSCMNGNQLDTTCNLVISAPMLVLPNLDIQDLTGVQYFDNLETLDCHGNLLTSLPPLPATVTILNINDNLFDVPPVLPPNLVQFYCNNNHLTSLPPLPAGLNILSFNGNQVTSIQSLVFGLTFLAAGSNLLTALPPLPNSLTSIVVSDNLLTSLPTLPASLNDLTCNDNFLTSLPALPAVLKQLKCSANQLQQLPALPPGLDYLSCANNLLVTLPALPLSLTYLSAHDNQLTDLLPFPTPVFHCFIDISSNPISCLPHLPDSVSIIICETNISCLPNIPEGFNYANCGDTLPPICQSGDECMPYNVSGYAFQDLNNNCFFDAGEPPIAGRIIGINAGQFYAYTDSNGYYTFYTGIPGSYELSQVNPDATLWSLPCNGNILSVTVINPLDTFNHRDFPNQFNSYCAMPAVDISSGGQVLCSGKNTYSVSYCNKGTLSGFNIHIEVEFDPEIIPLSSTLPWTSVSGNVYTFDIGTLAPGNCGSFLITDSISCDALIDQTASVRAAIFPDSTCEPLNPLWDLSDVIVTGGCSSTGDSVIFTLKNVGSGAMSGPAQSTIYEDDLLMSVALLQLGPNQDSTFVLPSTGKTYRMEMQQTPNHPGRSQPRSFVELCGSGSFSLNQIIPVIQDDADDWVEIDCELVSASGSSNIKTVQPSGIGPLHLVTPEDDLDYTIKFQNTGTDTVFNILIVDTLNGNYLDVKTIEPGPSSHPYSFSLEGKGVAKFALNNVFLPGIGVNEPLSQGYVKYKIRQQPGNAPGTVINDVATVYFDYQAGTNTDTAFVTIAEKNTIFPGVVGAGGLASSCNVVQLPNPFSDYIQFKITGPVIRKNFKVVISNVLGEEIYRSSAIHSENFKISPAIGESGIYFFRIYNDNVLIGRGKLVRK